MSKSKEIVLYFIYRYFLPETSVISSMGGIPFVNFSGKVHYLLSLA